MDTYGAVPIVFVLLFGTASLAAIALIDVLSTGWKYALIALPVGLLVGMFVSLVRTIRSPDTVVSSR